MTYTVCPALPRATITDNRTGTRTSPFLWYAEGGGGNADIKPSFPFQASVIVWTSTFTRQTYTLAGLVGGESPGTPLLSQMRRLRRAASRQISKRSLPDNLSAFLANASSSAGVTEGASDSPRRWTLRMCRRCWAFGRGTWTWRTAIIIE